MKEQQSQIRFGILCNGFHFPAWQVATIKKLIAAPDVKLELLIFDSRQKASDSPASPSKSVKHLFWNLYNQFYVNKKSKALKKQDLSPILKEIPSIDCKIVKKGDDEECLEDSDVEKIRSKQLDFILKFGFGNLKGEILHSARFGVWAFQHRDLSRYKGNTACFWEIFNGDLVTGAVLQKLVNEADCEIILKKGFLKTEVSYPKNIDQIHFESTGWPLKLCVDIRNNQEEIFTEIKPASSGKRFSHPANFQLIQFFFKQLMLLSKKAYKSLFITDYWNIGVALGPIQAFLDPQNLPEVKWFPDLPKNKFIADPFGIYHDNELHIIYEDFLFHERIGKTAALEFNNNEFKDNGIVIDEEFHMSYPFVFNHKDEIYCIPETYQANQVRLYKASDFPKKWQLDRVLIDNYAGIDNTLFEHDGYWWLFSTDKQNGVHYNLNVFFSKNIFDGWQDHPKNPVKTDIRSARPAGSIFHQNGEIYRPSMDYSEKVEGRIVINKILKLTTTDFKEEEFCTINPYTNTYFSDKIHTLSDAGPVTIIDGAKELFVPGNIHALKYKLISLFGKFKKR